MNNNINNNNDNIRKAGRPKKEINIIDETKRKAGRPKKEINIIDETKRKAGRPKKEKLILNDDEKLNKIKNIKIVLAEKSKKYYYKRKADGTNKKIKKPEEKLKAGRPKKEITEEKKTKGRPKNEIENIENIPKYIKKYI